MANVKLSNLATISENIDDADFYVRKKGSQSTLGDVLKERPEDSHDSSWFGIKLNSLGLKYLEPRYLYYFMMNLKFSGFYLPLARGTTKLVNFRKEDIGNIIFQIPDESLEQTIDKTSFDRNLRILKIQNIAKKLL
jgi:hypothetical protein